MSRDHLVLVDITSKLRLLNGLCKPDGLLCRSNHALEGLGVGGAQRTSKRQSGISGAKKQDTLGKQRWMRTPATRAVHDPQAIWVARTGMDRSSQAETV
jgi:hypothetical protein